MSFNRYFILTVLIILVSFFEVSFLYSQEDSGKPSIVIVPMAAKDVPSYVPMIVERLLAAKIDKTGAYFIFDREVLDKILSTNKITLPENISDDVAAKIGQKLEVNNVLYGRVSEVNSEFVIHTKVLDTDTGSVIAEDTEKSKDLKGLDEAISALTRSIVKTVLPKEAVAEAVQTLDAAEQTDKEAATEESVSAFEKLVQEDPDKALAAVSEPAREAIKEQARQEVVGEEVQNLFEEEKANKRRVWQFWSMIGLESSVQLGNLFGSSSIDLRLESLLSWNNYMNGIFIDDPYRSYRDNLQNSQSDQVINYIFTGGANIGLAFAYKAMPDDLFSFTNAGRAVFAISSLIQISGYMAQAATAQLGFYAQRKYFDYSTATSNFTEKYEAYRTAYLWPLIAEYSRTGLWTLGIAGMVTAALLPGDKSPMILSDKSRKYLTWGQTLISIGNFTSGMANNFRGKAEEYWISDNSPSGTIGDSSYLGNFITSEVFYYSTYAIYLGGAVLTYMGLTYNGPEIGVNTANGNSDNNLSFAVVPAPNGLTAVVRLRLD